MAWVLVPLEAPSMRALYALFPARPRLSGGVLEFTADSQVFIQCTSNVQSRGLLEPGYSPRAGVRVARADQASTPPWEQGSRSSRGGDRDRMQVKPREGNSGMPSKLSGQASDRPSLSSSGAVRSVAVTSSLDILSAGSPTAGHGARTAGAPNVDSIHVSTLSLSHVRWATWRCSACMASQEAVASARGDPSPAMQLAAGHGEVGFLHEGHLREAVTNYSMHNERLGPVGSLGMFASRRDQRAAVALGLEPLLAVLRMACAPSARMPLAMADTGSVQQRSLGLLFGASAPQPHQALALRVRLAQARSGLPVDDMRAAPLPHHSGTHRDVIDATLPALQALSGSASRTAVLVLARAHPTISLRRTAALAGVPLSHVLAATGWLDMHGFGSLLSAPVGSHTRFVPSRRRLPAAPPLQLDSSVWAYDLPAGVRLASLLGVLGSGCETLGGLIKSPWRLSGSPPYHGASGTGPHVLGATEAVDALQWALAVGVLLVREPKPLLCLPIDDSVLSTQEYSGSPRLGSYPDSGGGSSAKHRGQAGNQETYLQHQVLPTCSVAAGYILQAVAPCATGARGMLEVGREVAAGALAELPPGGAAVDGTALVEATIAAFPRLFVLH